MFRCSLYELPTLDNHQCNHSATVLCHKGNTNKVHINLSDFEDDDTDMSKDVNQSLLMLEIILVREIEYEKEW
jgi:hypothetical protein